jgi:hypothetical protein
LSIFRRKYRTFGLFVLKRGMSEDANALTDVAKVTNLEGPEELVAED